MPARINEANRIQTALPDSGMNEESENKKKAKNDFIKVKAKSFRFLRLMWVLISFCIKLVLDYEKILLRFLKFAVTLSGK